MNIFRSLTYSKFAFLWAGQTVPRFGDNLYRIALAWWVLEKTGSAAAIGHPDICGIAPLVLDYLYSGQTEQAWEVLYQIYPAEVAGHYKVFIESKLKDDIFFGKLPPP